MTDAGPIPYPLRPRSKMATPTAADALAAANAAANAAATTATTVGNRIDAVELQLNNIATQLQALITAAAAAGGGVGGAGGGGGGGWWRQGWWWRWWWRRWRWWRGSRTSWADSSRTASCSTSHRPVGTGKTQRRRSTSAAADMAESVERLSPTEPAVIISPNEQTAAFRMALDPSMQQVVEVALNIPPTTPLTPDEILDLIADYIRAKRNIALDRVAFDECHQSTSESFEDFYIRLRRLADAADLCGTASPRGSWQQAINVCRSEEVARINEKSLSNQSAVHHVPQGQRSNLPTSSTPCGSCGRNAHRPNETCPAVGKLCHNCGGSNHFSPRCPKPRKNASSNGGGNASNGDNGTAGNAASSPGARPKGRIGRILVGSVNASRRWRRAPTVSLQILDTQGRQLTTIDDAIPDGGAEISVGGLDTLSQLGMTEGDLTSSSYDLVMADRSSPLLVVGQVVARAIYGDVTAEITIVICPEISGLLIS
ncbi:Uncharacterized protein APZ42_030178 [Daphnia magna]|uniref:CCHC-type domain-containing protein n=1 Tax=Daphnia magna TaxID=35525 RepID=A0A162D3G9_9CRUS|nr:Uncharacterized protein APZ42_030178 [Daphnia magna]